MKAKRKLGKTIYKSKKKRKLDDVRVQQETRTRESGNEIESVSEAKVTNLKPGKPSYTKVIDERDSKGNQSLRQMQSTAGEGGTYGDVGKGKYISFDKDMNLTSGGKKIKNIDPITLGDMVEASANKFFKNGGKMKAKKYKKGGQVDPPKGKKLTKEMVDKQHSSDLDKSANVTNKLAKQAATGMKSNGFPMKKEAVKALAKDVEKRKKRESTSKPNYRDVGKNLPGGASPRFKKGGKFPPKIKAMLKKSKAPKKGGMIDEVTVTAKAPTKTEKAVAKEFSKGLSELKLGFPNTAVQQYYQLESVGNKSRKKGIQSRGDIEGAFESEEKLKKDTRKRAKRGQAFRYKMGGKIKKYLKGGQVKLDANKDGKITGQDFKMLKKK